MAMTEQEVFDSTDPVVNSSRVYQYTVVANIYSVIRVLALDIFEDRYKIFLLPLSFNKSGKKTLQRGLNDFKYSFLQKKDKSFLMSVFNIYEAEHGKKSTIELLDWIRNVEDRTASSLENHLSNLYDIKQREKKLKIPPRIERYFGIHTLLRDQYLNTMASRELDPSWFESKWDKSFYEKQAYDYYGEIENTWNPSDEVSLFAHTLHGKIAWENACQGDKPNAEELKTIGDWIIGNTRRPWPQDYEDPAFLNISPILRAEYVKRGIVRD